MNAKERNKLIEQLEEITDDLTTRLTKLENIHIPDQEHDKLIANKFKELEDKTYKKRVDIWLRIEQIEKQIKHIDNWLRDQQPSSYRQSPYYR